MVEALVQSHEEVLVAPAASAGEGGAGDKLQAAGYTDDYETGKLRVPLIRLLPALPAAWAANGGGFAKGLRARGGFAVDVSWDSAGKLTAAAIRSEGGNSAYVTLGQTPLGAVDDEGVAVRVDGAGEGVFVRLEGKRGSVFKVTLAGP
jgi:alpha-L-fucosidase 2